jgi:hypothetical protein
MAALDRLFPFSILLSEVLGMLLYGEASERV